MLDNGCNVPTADTAAGAKGQRQISAEQLNVNGVKL